MLNRYLPAPAGLGHFQNTQFTVNNQIVHATLMAICDDPNRVRHPFVPLLWHPLQLKVCSSL